MADRLQLQTLSVTKRTDEYRLTLGWFDWDGAACTAQAETDLNLGHIMTAFSACLKCVLASERHQYPKVTERYGGPIELTSWGISGLSVAPFRWQMTMTTERFSYTVNMDRDLEHVMLAFSGALKFFAFKYGLSTLGAEVVRQRDRAGEAGLLTKEDFQT